MCTRYVSPDQAAIERAWHIGRHNQNKWPAQIFPRASGPFLRAALPGPLELVVGQWGLVPSWARTAKLTFATSNARSEELMDKATYREAWKNSQRCLIPATSFDEPNWASGHNIWWRFHRADGLPWALAGLWNLWTDKRTGEVLETYTLLTVNADEHALMSQMHKPDPRLPADRQDKRSVVAIEQGDIEQWLFGRTDEASQLFQAPPLALIVAGPLESSAPPQDGQAVSNPQPDLFIP